MIITFCGHRDFIKTEAAEIALTGLLENYVQQNAEIVCYNGGYGNFYQFATACVKHLQKRYSNIRNCLVVPYIPATDPHAQK